jgi:hypothetical protein
MRHINGFCNLGASAYAGAGETALTGFGFVVDAAQSAPLVAFATKAFSKNTYKIKLFQFGIAFAPDLSNRHTGAP